MTAVDQHVLIASKFPLEMLQVFNSLDHMIAVHALWELLICLHRIGLFLSVPMTS